jgi:dGTPase
MGASIREETCLIEHKIFSKNASFADCSRGRVKPEPECSVRTVYQRDRDRIIHSNSFRRLKHKTQVFLSPEGDHYRTRLTHTLEVSQIARTIARCLRLNEDLTEAIALGHDLGHTPFGHAGERALNEVCENGFQHFSQSLRVVDILEKDGKGLNLTYEVRNGIERHTSGENAVTLEGRIVRLADRIAYINHDIDDACHAGVLKENDIPLCLRNILGKSKSDRINTLVISTVQNSVGDIRLSPEIQAAFDELNTFMTNNVYTNPICKSEEGKAMEMVKWLFNYFCEKPDRLPDEYKKIYVDSGAQRAACDYIAGMTDRYAVKCFNDLFVPKSWVN